MVKNKIIFIDSDGTVIDSMNFKHFNCFGPALIDTFKLRVYRDAVLKEWNRLNLFSLTRGINRFDGLYEILCYINDRYEKIEILDEYKQWLDTTSKKSNQKLIEYIKDNKKDMLQIVVDWSNETNRRIKHFQEDIKPFAVVKNALETLAKKFILIVVSSANKEAIEYEWTKYGLNQFVDVICTQEIGTKETCITKMIAELNPTDAVMIGDALGDLQAAKENNILFYPIVPGHENKSWTEFINKYQEDFEQGKYSEIEFEVIKNFKSSLQKGE